MEEAYVLNEENFRQEGVVDVFESFIWTDRYSSCGDFEIYTSISTEYVDLLKPDRILWIEDSVHSMFIEKIETITDLETGNYLLVSGESLESILKRRIIWSRTVLNGNLQNGIEKLLNDNIIRPSLGVRRIDNFVFERSEDPEITKLTFEGEFTGDDLYESIVKICESVNIGFMVILNRENQYVFKLYRGTDRSYSQTKNPHVVFSPNFDNIVDGNYLNDITNYKNVTLVAGDGEDNDRKTAIAGNNSLTGIKRRELFTDARDISSTDDDGNPIPISTYNNLLITRGNEKLKDNKVVELFDGEVDATRMYVYGRDFYMGDITQLESQYFAESRVRVIEFIYSIDKSGIKNYPTFEVIDEEEVS